MSGTGWGGVIVADLQALARVGLAVALAVVMGACGQPQTGSPKPGSTTQRTTSDKTTTDKPTEEATGSVDASIVNGNEQISCNAIDTQVKVVATGGKAHWTASAKRSSEFADKLLAQGVQLTPAEGVLEQGQSAVIRVRGSFDQQKYFYVFLATPTRTGSGGRGVQFKCR
jgi:hypothetical protein